MAFVDLSEVAPKPIRWQWPNRIPIGAITVVLAVPGVGKSLLTYYIAACVTLGRAMYNCDGRVAPANVLMLQGEDSLEARMIPALRAAGADLSRIRAFRSGSGESPISLPRDLAEIERQAGNVNARLIVIDPFSAFFRGNLNSDLSVRDVFGPLGSMANRIAAAILIVVHVNKTGRGPALYRAAGSLGIGGVARSVLVVGGDPVNPEHRVLSQAKNNLGPCARSLSFAIVDHAGAPMIEWLGESTASAESLLQTLDRDDQSRLRDAIFVLFSVLGEGKVLAKDAAKSAAEAGVAGSTLKRAKRRLGVESRREGFGPRSRFWWSLDEGHPLVQELRAGETATLMDRLIHGDDDDDDDDGDAWKHA